MLNISLDALIDSEHSQGQQAQILTHLKQLSQQWSSNAPLLIQLREQHSDSAVEKLCNTLALHGWPEETYTLHRWSPIQGLLTDDPINQALRNHAACWHGSHLDLCFEHWPRALTNTAIPQTLLLLNSDWAPSGWQTIKLQLRYRRLKNSLGQYIAIGIDQSTSISKLLKQQHKDAPWMNRNQLFDYIQQPLSRPAQRQRQSMAWVTPMPPARSGIATYSASLLPALQEHYNVTVITDEPGSRQANRHSTEWLLNNGQQFDRIVYHIGNSPFHKTIQDCALRWPGVLVMHELFIGDLQNSYGRDHLLRAMYQCHGYNAVQSAIEDSDSQKQTLQRYSTNRTLLQRSLGSIVHSQDAQQQISAGLKSAATATVPMVNSPRPLPERLQARQALNLSDDTVLICSFGMLGEGKGSLQILEGWSQLPKAIRDRTQLVFVGSNNPDEYGESLLKSKDATSAQHPIVITGWTSDHDYNNYLASCDFAVQLRTINRGETSAAVTDVICAGIPIITNNKGSFQELSTSSAQQIPAEFEINDITSAMHNLLNQLDDYRNTANLNQRSLKDRHSTKFVAQKYYENLESFYTTKASIEQQAIKTLSSMTKKNQREINRPLCEAIANTFPQTSCNKEKQRQLLVDVTQIAQHDLRTGIQRVVRAIVFEWIKTLNDDIRIEPVYVSTLGGYWHYRYARDWTFSLIGDHPADLHDEPIELNHDDQLVLLDLNGSRLVEAHSMGLYDPFIKQGIKITGIIYDILPILHPSYFPDGSRDVHHNWLMSIASISDQLICISKAVADETRDYLNNQPNLEKQPSVSWFHLGAEISQSSTTEDWPAEHEAIEQQLKTSTSFLMVGTVEPRKGHLQTIQAVRQLLDNHHKVSLIIVGKQGWMIDNVLKEVKDNPYIGRSIHWLNGLSDSYLNYLYQNCDCLIAASEAEGFGLPLIEAARQGMPIVARDIPVFREVANDAAFYFKGDTPEALADALCHWIELSAGNEHPKPEQLQWLSWRESSEQLLEHLALTPRP